MLSPLLFKSISKHNNLTVIGLIIAFVIGNLLLGSQPVYAHHPMGGTIPANFIQGFLSGLAHPVIGLDHLFFVVAVGLMAVGQGRFGLVIPITFVLTTVMGTGTHLLSLDLPLPELIISISVLVAGIILANKNYAHWILLLGLGAIAGIFHGYAYGEAIVGAEHTPLFAYLFGFSFIQLLISAIAFSLGRLTLQSVNISSSLPLRFAGFLISGVGIAFCSTALFG